MKRPSKIKAIICKIIGHKWTGKDKVNKSLMLLATGHSEGCIRCGVLR